MPLRFFCFMDLCLLQYSLFGPLNEKNDSLCKLARLFSSCQFGRGSMPSSWMCRMVGCSFAKGILPRAAISSWAVKWVFMQVATAILLGNCRLRWMKLSQKQQDEWRPMKAWNGWFYDAKLDDILSICKKRRNYCEFRHVTSVSLFWSSIRWILVISCICCSTTTEEPPLY